MQLMLPRFDPSVVTFKQLSIVIFLKFIANAYPELQKCQTILSTRYTFLSQVG